MDKKKIAQIILPLLIAAAGCTSSSEKEVPFKYGAILQKTFGELGDGREIPVTIEKATEIDGSVTADGQYLFFSSDRDRGNFDIYLRSLTDITTVRVTAHPAKDTAPAVSPDGRYLAFISTREDPLGDLYVIKMNPKKMVENFASDQGKSYDDDTVNISSMTDPVSRAPLSVKDSDPSWSPDGRSVVFSSSRGSGSENLWICSRKGKDLRQLTFKGGIQPRFSQDGSLVVFVSYRENPQGEVYTVDIVSGKETRVTSSAGLKLYPSFCGANNDLIYTVIDRDSNGDGIVDFKDMSSLCRCNSSSKSSYLLTKYSSSAFRGRWFPVFPLKYLSSQEDNFKGVVFYSAQTEGNININVIPEYGIIPKRKFAYDQLSLAESYLRDEGDREKYILALLRVYYYFGDRKDAESVVSVSRALYRAASESFSLKDLKTARSVRAMLSSLSKKNDDFSAVTAAALDNLFVGKDPFIAYEHALKNNAKDAALLPYFLDDAASVSASSGNTARAASLYERILKEAPNYKRIVAVNYALASLSSAGSPGKISPYYLEVIRKGEPFQKDRVMLDIIRQFSEEKDPLRRISLASKLYPSDVKKGSPDALFSALLDYITGAAYAEKGDSAAAAESLLKALTKLRTTDILYYESNILLASLSAKKGDSAGEERYLFSAATNYINRWNRPGYTPSVMKLVSYYENSGSDLEYAGDYKKASELYQRYVRLVTYLHWLKKFEGIYNEYGARAHVLYIDACANMPGETAEKLTALETEYSKEKLDIARLNYDKAEIYGLAYIYAKMGSELDRKKRRSSLKVSEEEIVGAFGKAGSQIDWALFMDDTFTDPYLLQGWINQYVDLRRKELISDNSFGEAEKYDDVFSGYLWERNTSVYQKALDVNDESKFPDKEGSLHLNLANTQFLLGNFPSALDHYQLAAKFKKSFGSKKEEALFRYHFGYCLWQNGYVREAKNEYTRILGIYGSAGGSKEYAEQRSVIYRYLALFERMEKNYPTALKWYNALLEESSRSRIRIDIPRTYIDSAWCWEQLGDDARAVSYLNRARVLLEKKDDNDPVFKLQIRPFGLFAFHLYDLGPDKVVIGNTRLFGALSVAQEKLLLEASLERIAVKRGEYAKAREHIGRRIEILKKRNTSVDQDMMVRALNSEGYCLFMLGRYDEAKKRFDSALESASDPSVNNLQGMFASIRNIVDLYAIASENNLPLLKNPEKELSVLRNRIVKFKADYEKVGFEKEKSSLEAAAKEKKTQVRPEDLEAAREKIAAEAAAVYADLDIAAATVDYYTAEFLSVKNPPADPSGVYRSQDALFRIYMTASSVFEEAASAAAVTPQKKAKLLLNAAECCRKTGMAEKAYELYGRAEKTAADAGRDDLLWKVYHREALFMRDSGASLDEDYLKISGSFFENACAIIEKAPALYAQNVSAAADLYRSRAVLAAGRGELASSLRILERGYAVERVMMTSLEPLVFSGRDLSSDWEQYVDLLFAVKSALKERSDLLAQGKKDTDPLFTAASESLKTAYDRFNAFGRELAGRNPLLSSFLYVRSSLPEKKDLNGLAVYCFLSDRNIAYAWRITGDKVESAVFKGEGETLLYALKGFMKGKDRCFVVLNDSSEMLFSHSKGFIPFTFIPSADRAGFFAGKKMIGYGKVSAASLAGKDLLSADLLVDDQGGSVRSALWSRSSDPSLAVTGYVNSRQARSVIESALWTDCRTVLFSLDQKTVRGKDDLFAVASDASSVTTADAGFIAAGADGTFAPAVSLSSLKDREKESSLEYLAKGDVKGALIHFSKYESMTDAPLSAEDEYLLARIYDLAGEFSAAALHACASASDGRADHISLAVYSLLLNGDCAAASALLSSSAGDAMFFRSADNALYCMILSAVKTGSRVVMSEGESILPKEKLKLLASRYALISGSDPIRADLSAPSSLPDQCMSVYSGSVLSSDPRISSIQSLRQHPGQYEKALILSAGEGSDALPIYPLLAALPDGDARGGASSAFLGAVTFESVSKALPADRIIFLQKFKDASARASLNEQYGRALALLETEFRSSGMTFQMNELLLEKTSALAAVSRHKEAGTVLKTLAGSPTEMQTVRSSLLSAECEIFTGDIKSGISQLEALSPGTDGMNVTKELLLAHAERLLVLKNPSTAAEGLPRYESHMKKVISLLERSLFTSEDSPRKDLLDSGLDFMASFSMGKNDTRSALLYTEIKRQTGYWRATGERKVALSRDESDAYLSAKDPSSYWAALSRYPSLADEKRILFPTVEAFQKKLPYGSVAVVVVKNEQDLFFWTIERESVQPFRIPGGYAKAEALVKRYRTALSDMTPVSAVSAELNALIAPAFRMTEGKHLYLVTDEYTENIPFEIAGAAGMLGRSGKLAYLTSLSGSLGNGTTLTPKCVVIGLSDLDAAAVRESGIGAGDVSGGVVHFAGNFDEDSSGLLAGGRPVRDRVKDKGLVWIGGSFPSDSESFFASDLLSGTGSSAVISGASDGEVSSRYFASVLYEHLAAGDTLQEAFAASAAKVSGSQNYSHPAFWAGIRLYLKTLPEQ